MTDKTEVFSPQYYFNSAAGSFKVSNSCILGRKEGDLILKDSKLSGQHCKFILRGLKLFVVDLGSTNGTFVNGERLEANVETEINFGD